VNVSKWIAGNTKLPISSRNKTMIRIKGHESRTWI